VNLPSQSECHLPENDKFSRQLLYCIGDDSADSDYSSESTFSVTGFENIISLMALLEKFCLE